MKSKAIPPVIALVMAVLALTGCAEQKYTMYDTETLYVEREGAQTRVYDRVGGAAYTFTSHRVKKDKGTAAQVSEATTTADTSTIKIQTIYGLIIVTDKTTRETLYIR